MRVMVNGLPGKMATKVAEHVIKSEQFELLPYALTGSEIPFSEYRVGGMTVGLIRPGRNEMLLEDLMAEEPFLCVDFTQPSAANDNADLYCKHGLSFVMGTTGGDVPAMQKKVIESDSLAVIAPNMAKPIILFQEMMRYAAENFPDAFKGYQLEITESHQKGKADTSGTAKAMVESPDGTPGYFNRLGIPFKKEQIKMIREPDVQITMRVPAEHLGGHGWHTYALKSEDGSVLLQFTHNVNGRDVYASGTLDALNFLWPKVVSGERGKVYSMMDVLRGK